MQTALNSTLEKDVLQVPLMATTPRPSRESHVNRGLTHTTWNDKPLDVKYAAQHCPSTLRGLHTFTLTMLCSYNRQAI